MLMVSWKKSDYLNVRNSDLPFLFAEHAAVVVIVAFVRLTRVFHATYAAVQQLNQVAVVHRMVVCRGEGHG